MMVECFWTPFKKKTNDGKLISITDRSIKTKADWEKVIKPTATDIEDRMQYVREYKEAVKGTKMGVTLAGACFFQTLYEFTVGLTDFMTMIYDQRDLVEEMFDVSAEYFHDLYIQGLEAGIDVVFVADDYAWKQGTFVRPKVFKEIWLPRMAKIIEPAVNRGIPVIFHSDGKIDATIDWLLDIGVEAITPMDPYSIDYRDYKKRYGNRLCLFGNIDVEFPLVHGTPDDVDKDVKAHSDVLKPGGRWVAGSSHSTGNMVPHENFCAMINAFHKYGKY
jgi:uroporphyrinogen decarboxylase